MVNRNDIWRMPGEQHKVLARLNITVRPQVDDGATDALRYIKLETVKPAMFALFEDNRRVASRLAAPDPVSVVAFGTAEQE